MKDKSNSAKPRVLPILLNTEMARAVLKNIKTETRRVVKPQPKGAHDILGPSEENDGTYEFFCGGFDGEKYTDWIEAVKMPYHPGDTLYVRETWTTDFYGTYHYRADFESDYLDPCETLEGGYPASCRFHPGCDGCERESQRIRWRPSIHMPKDAARIFLRVKDVRAERLQDLTDEDVVAEGLQIGDPFDDLWDSTIKPADRAIYGWEADPWVWVIEFQRISKEEALRDAG